MKTIKNKKKQFLVLFLSCMKKIRFHFPIVIHFIKNKIACVTKFIVNTFNTHQHT